jgi:heme exporter protein D
MMVTLQYTLLTYAVVAYGVLLGDNWHWYAMALMLAAIRAHYVRTVASERRAVARVPRGRRRHERSHGPTRRASTGDRGSSSGTFT